jgi:hypothetical protein
MTFERAALLIVAALTLSSLRVESKPVTDPTVQFVLFQTALTANQFVKTWTPIASRFVQQGLNHIVLAHSPLSQYAFVSRNLWTPGAYSKVAPSIGDGGGGPVRALQAGAFELAQTSDPSGLERAQVQLDKVIALLPDALAVTAITRATPSIPQARVVLYNAIGKARFAGIAELYVARGRGAAVAQELRLSDSRAVIGVYAEVLTLP